MPRPKTEMTKSGKTIAVRATLSEWNEFKRLGGTKWLRQFLADSIEKHQQTKETKWKKHFSHSGLPLVQQWFGRLAQPIPTTKMVVMLLAQLVVMEIIATQTAIDKS